MSGSPYSRIMAAVMFAVALCLGGTSPTWAQLGPAPGLSPNSLGQPNGPAQLDSGGTASSLPVLSTGTSAPRTLAARAADRLNLLDYAPAGTQVDTNGKSDASAALANAVAAANGAMSAGHFVCIYIPSGTYRIVSRPPVFGEGLPGCIVGEGPQKSVINLDPAFAGDLFAWSEAWPVSSHTSGAHVANLRINGSPHAVAQQNALMFYDRNDNVSLQSIDIWNLPGRALYSGMTKNTPAAYLRESHLRSMRFFNDGAPGVPVVEFNSNDNNNLEDASNEISVSQMDIFGSNGPSLVLRSTLGVMRDLKFDALRIEGTYGGTTAADLLTIGDPSLLGAVVDLSFTNCELLNGYRGYAALRTTAANASLMPYGISFQGGITGGSQGEGVRIDAGRSMKFQLHGLSSVGPNVVIGMASGSTTVPQTVNMVGGNIVIDGYGVEPAWSYAVNPIDSQALVTPVLRTGVPNVPGASGGAITAAGTMRSDAVASTTGTIQAGSSLANQPVLSGAASGTPVGLNATGQDADIPLLLTGKGDAGTLVGLYNRAAPPVAGDIPSSTCADWRNTSDGSTKRYCNVGGAIASIPPGRLVLTFATAGSYTAVVPPWATTVDVDETAGGASGANGAAAPRGTAVSGGAGGSGGLHRHFSAIPASLLGSSMTIVVGAGGGAPTGPGAPGNPGAATTVTSGNMALPVASAAGASSGGGGAASASGGTGGPYSNGANASGPSPGATAYGIGGVSGAVGNYSTVAGLSGSGGGGALGGPGGGGGGTIDGVSGAGAGGGVSIAGIGQPGGNQPAQASLGSSGGGIAPGGNASVPYAVVTPGMNATGGAGGGGGDASHPGGNGSQGAGAGAPGGGGGSTLTGRPFGLGAPGRDGQVVLVFSP